MLFTSEQTEQDQYLTWWVTLFPLLPGEVFRQETCVWGVQEEVGERRLPPSSSWWRWKAISWETRWHKEGRLLHTETRLAETVNPLWRDNMLTWLSSELLFTDRRYATLRMCNTSSYIVCQWRSLQSNNEVRRHSLFVFGFRVLRVVSDDSSNCEWTSKPLQLLNMTRMYSEINHHIA